MLGGRDIQLCLTYEKYKVLLDYEYLWRESLDNLRLCGTETVFEIELHGFVQIKWNWWMMLWWFEWPIYYIVWFYILVANWFHPIIEMCCKHQLRPHIPTIINTLCIGDIIPIKSKTYRAPLPTKEVISITTLAWFIHRKFIDRNLCKHHNLWCAQKFTI